MNKEECYEDFCLFCVGGARNGEDIDECEDEGCPFHAYRFGGLNLIDEKQIARKILKDTGVIKGD